MMKMMKGVTFTGGLQRRTPSSSNNNNNLFFPTPSSFSSPRPTTTFLFFFLFPILLILSFPSQLAPPSHLLLTSSSSSSSSSSRGLLLVAGQCNGSHLVFTGSSGPYGQVGPEADWYRVTDAVSLEIWINPTTVASSSYDGIWGATYKEGANFDAYSLFLDACGVNFLVGTATTSDARVRLPVPYGKWSYIVATYNSTSLAMYLNGKFMATGSPQSGPINYRKPNELWIGRFYGLQDDRKIRARLDGFRLWNRVLNASEIADYFANPRFIAADGTNKLLTSLNFDEGAGSDLNDGTNQHSGYLTGDDAWENDTCSADCSFCVPTITPTHTPSTVNYTFNYNPFNWVDPELNNHTEIAISVQPTAAVSLGFNFTFFDSNFSSVYMDTSGLIYFIRPADLLCIDQPVYSTELPGQNGISACFSRMSPGKLYATTLLDTNTNLRVFIVSWIRWTLQGTGAAAQDQRSFQVKLFENSSRIEIHYNTMNASTTHDRGGQASVGLCEAVPNDVPISEVTCYLRGWNRQDLPSRSSLIICRDDDPATVLCEGIDPPVDPVEDTSSSNNDALIAGIVGGLGGFLLLFICCVVFVGLVWFLGYRGYKWNRSRVPYLEAEMEERAKAFEKPCKEIAWEDLEVMELLGTGAFGKVYKAKWRGAHVAVKVCTEIQLDLADNQTLAEIKQEASLMEHLGHHPNVVSFFGTVTKGARFAMVTEYCAYGSLFDLLIAKKQAPSRELTREMVLKMLRGVARGILYLHEERVIHRDISARNVLVAKDFTVRISDFGLARLREDSPQNYGVTKSNIGPVRWMAPEAIINRKYSEKSDAWSYGVLIWEVVTQSEPWANIPLLEIAVGVGKKGWRLKIPKNCDPFLAHLMRDCWKQEPAERPSFKEIEARFSTELAADDTEGEKSPSDEEDSGSDSEVDMEMPADMRKREQYDIKMDVFSTSKRDLETGTSSASSDD